MTVWQYLVLGVGIGGLYGLASLGLVVVYRGSGIINFAHGAIGMVGAYAFWELHDQNQWGFTPALAAGLAVSAGLGILSDILVIRRLRFASPVAQLLGTIAILITLQSAVSLRYPEEVLVVAPSLPQQSVVILGARVGEDQLWLLGIAVAITILLTLMYRYTQFGRLTAAVAENPSAVSTLGHSVNRISSLNWGLGSALAGLAAILLAPTTGLQVDQLTALVIPALAAAVVGRMTSLPIAMAAGVGMGIVQSELGHFVANPAWQVAVPFFVVMLVLIARGSVRPRRGESQMRLPSTGSGQIRWLGLVVAIVAALLFIWLLPLDWVNGLTASLAYACVLLSIVVVTGYAGQLSFSQYTLAGLGALVAGHLVGADHWSFEAALAVGLLSAVPIGFLVGLPALRTRGVSLAIATLGFSVAVEALIFDATNGLTGGAGGQNVGSPSFFGIPIGTVEHSRNYAVLTLVLFVLSGLMVANIRRGKSGRTLLAARENERAAAALGVNVLGAKLYAFVIGSVIAALGGILIAFQNQTILYSSFQSLTNVNVVGLAVIGGVGTPIGPIYGSTLQQGGIGTNIGNLLGASVAPYLGLIGGLLLILVLLRSPDGIAGQMKKDFLRLRRWLPKRTKSRQTAAIDQNEEPLPLRSARSVAAIVPRTLRVHQLTVEFGGHRALDSVSLEAKPATVLGVIGPNGAGKTTLVDVMTGFTRPRSGSVYLDDRDITKLSPRRRAEFGVGRSFQSLELFENLTVLENLLVASEAGSWSAYATDLLHPSVPRLANNAEAAVSDFRLTSDLTRTPRDLPYGRRRLIAVARAVAADPSVLLLDEPASGLGESEREELAILISYLSRQRGMAILLIEHDVEFVMQVCDEIVVLDHGCEIARGLPADIRNDENVVRAYLGTAAVEQPAYSSSSAQSGPDLLP
jgi:sulfate-transporting ATPase